MFGCCKGLVLACQKADKVVCVLQNVGFCTALLLKVCVCFCFGFKGLCKGLLNVSYILGEFCTIL